MLGGVLNGFSPPTETLRHDRSSLDPDSFTSSGQRRQNCCGGFARVRTVDDPVERITRESRFFPNGGVRPHDRFAIVGRGASQYALSNEAVLSVRPRGSRVGR